LALMKSQTLIMSTFKTQAEKVGFNEITDTIDIEI